MHPQHPLQFSPSWCESAGVPRGGLARSRFLPFGGRGLVVAAVGLGEDFGGEDCDDCTAGEEAHQHQILLRRMAKQQVPGHRGHDQEQRRAEPDRKYSAARPADCAHALGAAGKE